MQYNSNLAIPKVKRIANPEYKEEYEMPANYQEMAKTLVKLIESRDEYAKMLPTVPPGNCRKARLHFNELNQAIEDFEEKLAYEYEFYQEEQRLEQEFYEITDYQNSMSEELFIIVKHKKPYLFDRFVEYATKGMTEEEREEQYAIIANRERKELADILSGKCPLPEYRNPFIKQVLPDDQIPEYMLKINSLAYETDDFFKQNYEILEQGAKNRNRLVLDLSRALPIRRKSMEKQIVELTQHLRTARNFVLNYAEENKKKSKFAEIENPDQEKLDEYFKQTENAREVRYILIKHCRPDKFKEFDKIAVEDYTDKEKADFYERIAKREEKQLNSILKSLEVEQKYGFANPYYQNPFNDSK